MQKPNEQITAEGRISARPVTQFSVTPRSVLVSSAVVSSFTYSPGSDSSSVYLSKCI